MLKKLHVELSKWPPMFIFYITRSIPIPKVSACTFIDIYVSTSSKGPLTIFQNTWNIYDEHDAHSVRINL